MATVKRTGFGQVELNQVAGGMITGQLVDQVEAAEELGDILEQGQFVRLSEDGKTLVKPSNGVGPFLMVYNEEYFYDERDHYHKDFAMKQEDYYDRFVPRCYRIIDTDKFTTNMIATANTGKNVEVEILADMPEAGDVFVVSENGYLIPQDTDKLPAGSAEVACEGSPEFIVLDGVGGYGPRTCATTMPDMQKAVKLLCKKACL